jgi:hypothetical protein
LGTESNSAFQIHLKPQVMSLHITQGKREIISLFTKFLPLLFCCVFYSGKAQVNPENSISSQSSKKEIVIGFKTISLIEVTEIKNKISEKEGIEYKGFCEDQHCIALMVDALSYPEEKAITEFLLSVNPQFRIYYKESTFKELEAACGDREKLFTR